MSVGSPIMCAECGVLHGNHQPSCGQAHQQLMEKLVDLHRQATVERSHYYTGKVIKEAIDEIERQRATIRGHAADVITLGQMVGKLEAEIARLQSIIRKQMSPTDISRQLAECNELADAYAEQNVTIKELRAEVERLRNQWNEECARLQVVNVHLKAALERANDDKPNEGYDVSRKGE
jgi:DNA repair ATPase RecN